MFGSLAFNCQEKLNRSHTLLDDREVQMLFSAKPKPKPNEPKKTTPHRGSGRRDLSESLNHAFPIA
ncbi:heterocyst-inhibiting protein PatX [Fortiea sp. LEGE XX443]